MRTEKPARKEDIEAHIQNFVIAAGMLDDDELDRAVAEMEWEERDRLREALDRADLTEGE